MRFKGARACLGTPARPPAGRWVAGDWLLAAAADPRLAWRGVRKPRENRGEPPRRSHPRLVGLERSQLCQPAAMLTLRDCSAPATLANGRERVETPRRSNLRVAA